MLPGLEKVNAETGLPVIAHNLTKKAALQTAKRPLMAAFFAKTTFLISGEALITVKKTPKHLSDVTKKIRLPQLLLLRQPYYVRLYKVVVATVL